MDVHVLNTSTLRWSLLPMRKDQKYPQVPFQRYGEFLMKSFEKDYANERKKPLEKSRTKFM
jgi:hypothetical protein